MEVAALTVGKRFEGGGVAYGGTGPHRNVQPVPFALDVGHAVLDGPERVTDPLGGDAQVLGDLRIEGVLADLTVRVALPAAAEHDERAGRQLHRRDPQRTHPLKGEVEEGREAEDPYRQSLVGVPLERLDAAAHVELVSRAGVAQGVSGVLGRCEVAQVVVGEGRAELQRGCGLIAVEQVVDGLVRGDPPVVVEDAGHHALGGADGPLVEEHLRLLTGGTGGGEVEEDLVPGYGEQFVALEEVGVHQRGADVRTHARGRRPGLVGQQRPEERGAFGVPRVALGHRGGEEGVVLRALLVGCREVAQLLDVPQRRRIGDLDGKQMAIHETTS